MLHASASAMKGGDSGAAIVAEDLERSLLWERIAAEEMPPKHPLSADEKSIIRRWILQGAKWGVTPIDPFAFTTDSRAGRDWWSLQPLRRVSAPDRHDAWGRNEIDAFVLRRMKAGAMQNTDATTAFPILPSPEASRRELIRRVYFDLIGLPPSHDVVQAFEQVPDELADAAYERIVDDLLSSPAYGERWARHWLDVVRFGESDGFERNNPRLNAWPYRDWVIAALNKDMPYDEFVRQQLVGDLLAPGTEGIAATGFWTSGVHNTVVGGSERMKKLARQDELEEVLATVGQTFLGLTVNCARCHDHKFDPITQKEYYQLSSAISGLGYGEREATSAEASEKLAAVRRQASTLRRQLEAMDAVARKAIFRDRGEPTSIPLPPRPIARWDFDGDLRDSIGELHGKAHGNAKIMDGALIVDGASYVETPPLQSDVGVKTLEALVQLDTLNQSGGGVVTMETLNGVTFDSIVFGERDPKQWMAGSNGFVRSDSYRAPQESDAATTPVHIVYVYAQDGTITAYRNGLPYGQPIRKADLQQYKSGAAEVIFGLRHKPLGGNRMLKGKILHAAIYDRDLSPAEVEATAANATEFVTESELVAWFKANAPDRAKRRVKLRQEMGDLESEIQKNQAAAKQKLYALTPGRGAATRILLRGDPDNVGELVAPGGVQAVQGVAPEFGIGPEAPEAERRKSLAGWIADEANPLFARVIVNRLWHYHFGQGIVDTPNDFGFNGGRPSHPDLLDWLAQKFIEDGMRIKPMHRRMVLSSVYRQTSSPRQSEDADPASVDAGNRLLWRMNARRLEAEAYRDAILQVSGKLDRHRGGPSFQDVQITFNNGTTYYLPKETHDDAEYRRTIYRFNPRGGRSALLDTLDCPDSATTTPRRAVTTTPLQALSLFNNSLVLRMADAFAARVVRGAGADARAQAILAWKLALARTPDANELELSETLIADHGLPALCRGLFNAGEFVAID